LPQTVICVNSDAKSFFVAECRHAGMALISFVDSNMDPLIMTYPIVGNDDARAALILYCDLFSCVLRRARRREVLKLRAKCARLAFVFSKCFFYKLLGMMHLLSGFFLKKKIFYFRFKRNIESYVRLFVRKTKLFSQFFYKYYDSYNDFFFSKHARIFLIIMRKFLFFNKFKT
jgi:hypothetical protein